MATVIAGIRPSDEVTHAFVVFQRRTLENEEPRLPATKVFASLGEIAFLVASLHDGLLGNTDYI